MLAVTVSKSEEKKEVIFDHSNTLTQALHYDILGAFVKNVVLAISQISGDSYY